jgi:predicted small secreted protein
MNKTLILLAALLALTACNTVAGVGEDVAGGARTVQGWFGG